ncbi:hypothetical protein L0Z72_06375 [candidate division KSB1 bacterium]|nr:hypothetical protein [candidate division KSB1 bacterium]
MKKLGHSLEKIVASSDHLKQIRKSELQFGDEVIITTLNSVYHVRVLDDGNYLVSGGWFDKNDLSPLKTTIAGCTWGGSIIKVDIIAACGLCVEFGNRVVTSPIKQICLIPGGGNN